MIVMPLYLILNRCESEFHDVMNLTGMDGMTAFTYALGREMKGSYETILASARWLLRDRLGNIDVSIDDTYNLIDALSSIHTAIHTTLVQLYPYQYRAIAFDRLIGSDAATLRVYP